MLGNPGITLGRNGSIHEWEYVTVDQARAGHPLNGDLLVLLSGPIVPGKYLRSLPMVSLILP